MDGSSSSRRRFRRHVLSEGEDYLSNLPDELLHHILSFLPTIDSIRTSVLARRWRRVWTSVPVVDFSYLQLKRFIMKRFFASRSGDSVSRLHLSGLSILSIQRQTAVKKLGGHGSTYKLRIIRENFLYDLVEYAKSHGARHVTLLNFFFEEYGITIDSFLQLLFDWPSLLSLNLQVVDDVNFIFTISDSIAFRLSNLKTLSLGLSENIIPNEGLARLLSGCPVLEELRLNAKYPRHKFVQIAAPNLFRLTLITAPANVQITCPKLQYLRLKSEFSLTNLQIEAPSLTSVRFGTFVQTLCDVTAAAITVSDKCLSGLKTGFLKKYKAVVGGFPVFHKLLELKIKMYVAERLSLNIVFDLLRCVPNLQSLVLTESEKQPCDEDFDEREESSLRINEPLEHLKRVSMNIRNERIRLWFLKTLSETVLEWDRVAVNCYVD
ncbi:F-box/LRR-repeat protein 25-like [Zingiber officinale]|uniref:F-box/LRR-repeat protein 25-like n=1 Tax=Zingiber officinale TaxID=94328 RepID=UPI001C4B04C5|nr:F-box/LRR-repeat protein 25-like [Zingiber officinale]